MTPAEFWDATPREVSLAIEAAAWHQDQAERRAITTAWLTEAFARHRQLPPLDRVTGQRAGAQTPEEQLAIMQTFSLLHNMRSDGV
jgi:hypothetical protein